MRTQRLKTGAYKSKKLATRSARRVPPPLRFGAALVYVLIHHKPAGREVGLAKSGFRPTAPRAVHDRSLRLTRMRGRGTAAATHFADRQRPGKEQNRFPLLTATGEA